MSVAVGRVAASRLAWGLLRCGLCGRTLRPVGDGARSRYVCALDCPHPGVAAVTTEQDLLLRALGRAHVALYQVGRGRGARPSGTGGVVVSPAEARLWRWCDPADRAAMLRTAFSQVVVASDGRLHPVWRHRVEDDGEPA